MVVEQDSTSRSSNLTFFAGNSTLHGIKHIFVNGSWTLRRILWAAAFLSSLGIFLWQAYNRYEYYKSYPKISHLTEHETQIMNFPAITICNMNSFRLSKITTDDYYHIGELLGILDRDGNLEKDFRDSRTSPEVLQRIRPILSQEKPFKPYKNSFDILEFYNRTGHDLTDIVLGCRYRGRDCRNYWSIVFTRYGKCYSFNSGKNYEPLTILKGGIDNGLELLLDTQQNEYMPVWNENDEITAEAGFKVQIHKQNEPPFIHELGFGVSPGLQTLVATQEQIISLLPYPWGDCVDKSNQNRLDYFHSYSISACRIACETKFVWDNCSCRMIHMPGNRTYCTPEVYKTCADRALDYLLETDERQCLCRNPCVATRYDLETSMLRFPGSHATSYLARKYNKTDNYVKENFAKLNIFFEAIKYEIIEEKFAYEITELLADIGGLMALFIGASILTFLELFDYAYELIKDKTWGRNIRKKIRIPEQQTNSRATTELIMEE